MNYLDIIAIVGIGFGAFRGFRQGVIKEIAGLLGVILGVWLGLRLGFLFANYYRDNFDLPAKTVPVLGFITVFLLAMVGIWLLGRVLTFLTHQTPLGLPNRIAGATFGGLKWAFLVGTVVSILGSSEIIPKEHQDESMSYPILNTYCTKVQEYSVGLVPVFGNVFEEMDSYFTGIDSLNQDAGAQGAENESDEGQDENDESGSRRPGPEINPDSTFKRP